MNWFYALIQSIYCRIKIRNLFFFIVNQEMLNLDTFFSPFLVFSLNFQRVNTKILILNLFFRGIFRENAKSNLASMENAWKKVSKRN